MIARIGAYAITFVILAGSEIPFFPITLFLSIALKKAKWLLPFIHCILDVIKVGFAVLLASWLIYKIDQAPSWLMFLIPGYLVVHNNLMRINRVKAGRSNVKRILERNGEPESYDQRNDLWIERAHFVGDVVGWIAGTNLVLRSSSFF